LNFEAGLFWWEKEVLCYMLLRLKDYMDGTLWLGSFNWLAIETKSEAMI